jgi:hypothetical protein
MNASSTSTAELARLNWRLGIAYAEAVRRHSRKHPVKLDLIGCHGQTLYHQARSSQLCGPQLCLHLAGRRSAGDCCCAWRSCRFEFSPRGYAGRRPGRAAGFAARLRSVCSSHSRPRAAEHRRHRQPHRDSRRSRARRGDRLRHRAPATWSSMRWLWSFSASNSIATEPSPRKAEFSRRRWPRHCAIPIFSSSRRAPRAASSLGASMRHEVSRGVPAVQHQARRCDCNCDRANGRTIAQSYKKFVQRKCAQLANSVSAWTTSSPAAARAIIR